MRCVLSADVPWAYALSMLNSILLRTSSASQKLASAAVERSAPVRDPSGFRERSVVWPLSIWVCRSANVGNMILFLRSMVDVQKE